MKPNHKNKYLSRVLSERLNGWQVRLPEVSNGKPARHSKETINKLFSMSFYKDEDACLRAAIRWRNKYLRDNGGLHLLKQSMHRNMPFVTSFDNTSGAIGIILMTHTKECGTYYNFAAQWSDEKPSAGHRKKSFSCLKYGIEGAFKMACEVRYKHCGVIFITDADAIPCYPDVPYLVNNQSMIN